MYIMYTYTNTHKPTYIMVSNKYLSFKYLVFVDVRVWCIGRITQVVCFRGRLITCL